MTAGPLRSRISFHPLGRTVYQSLITGIPYPGRYDEAPDPDLAPWEDSACRDPLGAAAAPGAGSVRALTGQFRHAVLLTPSADGTAGHRRADHLGVARAASPRP